MREPGRIALSGLFVVIFAYMIFEVREYAEAAALAPMVVAVPGLLLALAQFLIDIRKVCTAAGERRGTEEALAVNKSEPVPEHSGVVSARRKRELGMIGWVLLILAMIVTLGFWITIALYLPLFLRFHGRESWRLTLTVSACGWATMYVVFKLLLGVHLFPGFLFS